MRQVAKVPLLYDAVHGGRKPAYFHRGLDFPFRVFRPFRGYVPAIFSGTKYVTAAGNGRVLAVQVENASLGIS